MTTNESPAEPEQEQGQDPQSAQSEPQEPQDPRGDAVPGGDQDVQDEPRAGQGGGAE